MARPPDRSISPATRRLPSSSRSPTQTAAPAAFVDETVDGYQIGAVRLSAELQAYLAAQGRDRLRVVAVDEVRAAMRAREYAPADLVSPTKAAEIAQAVGADWLITGRWVYLDLDRERQAGGGGAGGARGRGARRVPES